jgi:hypothetical protein
MKAQVETYEVYVCHLLLCDDPPVEGAVKQMSQHAFKKPATGLNPEPVEISQYLFTLCL